MDTGREQIIQQKKPLQKDSILYLLENIHIDEGNYFDRRIHDDIDVIVKDMQEAHKDRSESASDDSEMNPIETMKSTLDDISHFKGSRTELALMVFCKQNQIVYSKLTDEEKIWLTRIIQKSKVAKTAVSQRGKKK